MRSYLTSFLFLFFCSLTQLGALEETIVVQLGTEKQLLPLYLSPLSGEQGHQLRKILAFDLSHNGYTKVLPETQEQSHRLRQKDTDLTPWKREHVLYIVTVEIDDQTLIAELISVNQATKRTLPPFQLSGDLATDRMTIHQLADTIHQILFGHPGIATSHILYTVQHTVGNDSTSWISEIWECGYDGGNPRRITAERALIVTPEYLPVLSSKKRTAAFSYVSYRSGQPKIYLSPLDEHQPLRLCTLPGNQFMPRFSHDRKSLAFISDVSGHPDLFLQPLNHQCRPLGKPKQLVSSSRATQASPTFSPDGKELAFVSSRDGNPRIYVMQVNHSEAKARLITKKNRENSAPAWSPDGKYLAYCAKGADGVRQIWLANLSTGEERELTTGKDHKENPSWARNSLHLTFNSVDREKSELFLLNLHSPHAIKISRGSGQKRFPCFEP